MSWGKKSSSSREIHKSWRAAHRVLCSTALFFAVMALSACAQAPDVARMIPRGFLSPVHCSNKILRVSEVRGGEKTNPANLSTIEDAGFRQALIETLGKSGLFKSVVTDQMADYELQTQIVSQEHQGIYELTAILFVNYRLVESSSQREVWKENLLSTYVAKVEESLYGVERGRRANEGVVRENLRQLVEKLSQALPR
jgi:hypothetical protein